MATIPAGAESKDMDWVTLMFTDIEGSTSLVERYGAEFYKILERHFEILREKTEANDGRMIVCHSDSSFAAFPSSASAVLSAIQIQRAFISEDWPFGIDLKVRVGMHTGRATPVSDPNVGYVGIDVHRAARIAQSGSGGQVLLSGTTKSELPDEAKLKGAQIQYLGSHRFKDLPFPENVHELVIDGLKTKYPPIKSINNFPTNLPSANTKFIGRTAEIADVCNILMHGGSPILTLTGPGGVGKTRLSLEVARNLVGHFSDGVFQVLLGPITEGNLISSAIAQVLRVPDYPGRTILEDLKHFISSRKMLLILDNFEHVVDATDQVGTLVASCPQLRVLVTSREALKLSVEQEFPVPPMALPKMHSNSPELNESEAVKLFENRAVAANRNFKLDTENYEDVAKICKKLDGLPLAIELAASRLNILSASELRARLEQSMSALGRGPRDVDKRHQTLFEAIQWSHNLLDRQEQKLFRQLSVFKGKFNINDIDKVCNLQDMETDRFLDVAASLVDKNLLTVTSTNDGSQFQMLETIREYAFEQLEEAGEMDSTVEKHCQYYLALTEREAPNFVTSDQRRAVATVLDNIDNIRSALDWCIKNGRVDETARFLRALLWLWIPRGQFAEGRSWADDALQISDIEKHTYEFGVINDVAGWLQLISGDYAGSRPRFKDAFESYDKKGSELERERSLIMLGISTAVATEGADGLEQMLQALERCRELKDSYGTAVALIAMGEGARATGDVASANGCYQEALDLMRELDDQYWTGALLLNMSHVSLSENDLQLTKSHLNEVIELATEYDYPMMINLYVALTGEVLCRGEDFVMASKLFGAVTSMVEELGVTFEHADKLEFDRHVEMARESLGEPDFNEAFREGASWSRDKAIQIAKQT